MNHTGSVSLDSTTIERSLTRLVGAVLAERHDDWIEGRRSGLDVLAAPGRPRTTPPPPPTPTRPHKRRHQSSRPDPCRLRNTYRLRYLRPATERTSRPAVLRPPLPASSPSASHQRSGPAAPGSSRASIHDPRVRGLRTTPRWPAVVPRLPTTARAACVLLGGRTRPLIKQDSASRGRNGNRRSETGPRLPRPMVTPKAEPLAISKGAVSRWSQHGSAGMPVFFSGAEGHYDTPTSTSRSISPQLKGIHPGRGSRLSGTSVDQQSGGESR